MSEEKIHYQVYKFGKYYNPASLHYKGPIEVGCDRCDKHDIVACIGWGEYDICLECIAEMCKKDEDGDLAVYSDEN